MCLTSLFVPDAGAIAQQVPGATWYSLIHDMAPFRTFYRPCLSLLARLLHVARRVDQSTGPHEDGGS